MTLWHFPPGCIIENSVRLAGNDITWEYVENEMACAQLSASTDGGLFWTFLPDSKSCYVKSSDAGKEAYQNRVSGNKYCGLEMRSSGTYHLTCFDMNPENMSIPNKLGEVVFPHDGKVFMEKHHTDRQPQMSFKGLLFYVLLNTDLYFFD